MRRYPALSLGLVTSWFGPHLKGGAEQQARELVLKLTSCGHQVTVLTSCSESFTGNWDSNFYSPGGSLLEGVQILRFPVGRRKSADFNRVVNQMLSISSEHFQQGFCPVNKQTEAIYWENNFNSPALIQWLRENQSHFDLVLFMPYLFPLAKLGVEVLGKKALLQPCLHDEVYAYLDDCHSMFSACGGLLFNSRGELELARRIMGPWIESKSVVVGEGIDFSESSGLRPKSHHKLDSGQFLLCLGRRCKEKNTYELISEFRSYREKTKSGMVLVLAGPEKLDEGLETSGIIDLGLVSEDEKVWLLRHSRALIVPGKNESFSRVLYESWHYGRPVAVHEDCLATSYALDEAGDAGWLIGSGDKWQRFFSLVDGADPGLLSEAGDCGQRFSKISCSWESVLAKYQMAFGQFMAREKERLTRKILIVLPWKHDVPSLYLNDLKIFLHGLKACLNLEPEIVSGNSAIQHFVGLKVLNLEIVSDDESCRRRWTSAVWYSDQDWVQGRGWFKDLRCEKYQRLLSPDLSGQVSWPPGFFDVTLSPFSEALHKRGTRTFFLPPFTTKKSRTAINPDEGMKHRLLNQKMNIIFLDRDHSSVKSLDALMIALSGSESMSCQVYLPGSYDHTSTEVLGKVSFCKLPREDFLSHLCEYIASCDMILFANDPFEYLCDLELILSFKTPSCCLNSPWFSDLLRIPDFSWSESGTNSDPTLLDAYIHLCGTDTNFLAEASKLSSAARNRLRYASHPGNYIDMFN